MDSEPAETVATLFCPHCGEPSLESAERCWSCQKPLHASAGDAGTGELGDNFGIRLLLPVGRSAWAIAAGYLGLLSLVLVPAPFALAVGILAVRDLRKHPKKHGYGRAIFGIVAGAVGSVVLGLILFVD